MPLLAWLSSSLFPSLSKYLRFLPTYLLEVEAGKLPKLNVEESGVRGMSENAGLDLSFSSEILFTCLFSSWIWLI